jgi:hypothetical protein
MKTTNPFQNHTRMSPLTLSFKRQEYVKSAVIDVTALVFVYLLPSFSHMLNFPLYLVDPMRIMIIIALSHTQRKNVYLLALTLPVFSFVISAHPVFLKSLLITVELLFNVWLFYFLSSRIKSSFVAVFLSIFSSKLLYYLLKFIFIKLVLIDSVLITTPVWIQVVVMLTLSLYLWLVFIKSSKTN